MATAVFEAGTGLVLLVVPSAVIWLLLGVREPAPESLIVSRVGGAALLAIGVACWLARDDPGSRSRYSLLWGALTYNLGAGIVLGIAGLIGQTTGVPLWPAVVLHVVMAVWCAASIRATGGTTAAGDKKR